MRTAGQGAGRDAPVARTISCGRTQNRSAIGVVKRDRRTRIDTTTGEGWRGHAGDVVRAA